MLTPEQFSTASVYDLLIAASEGRVGIDQRWLSAITSRGEEAIPDLVRFAGEDHEKDPIPLDEELAVVVHQLRTPAAAPFFVEYLRNHPEDVPDLLVDAMFPIRESLVEPLIQLYNDLDEDESGEVAFALAAFRIPDQRVLKILLDRLEYDVGDGALSLGLYGDAAAKPALERMLAQLEDEHLKRDVEDAIQQLGREADFAEHKLDLSDYMPEKAPPPAAVLEESDLLDMLECPDEEYRLAAAGGFINRDASEAAVTKLFSTAREDSSEAVRARCWEALSTEVSDNDQIFEAMRSRLEDTSAPVLERAGALVGLGPRANEKPIRDFAEEFYKRGETRAAALSAMWNSLDRSFSKYFPPHLEDPDPDIRKQAISGVGYLGIHDSADKLRQYFDNDDYRSNALFAYALAVRAEVSPGRVRSLLRRIDQTAGGLSIDETELVELALDERLLLDGHKPVFHPDDDSEDEESPENPAGKVGRNDPCPCGSGKKFKKCHGG